MDLVLVYLERIRRAQCDREITKQNTMKTHTSKIDFMLIYGPLLLFVGMTVFMLIEGEPLNAVLTTGGILFATWLFILYLAHSIKYTISKDRLVIKCGFLYHKNLEVSRIKSIAETSNLISSPAASLDRIEIKLKRHIFLLKQH